MAEVQEPPIKVVAPPEPVITPPDSVLPTEAPHFTEVRNPQFNRLGTIDCEVLHRVYGWIPFTATDADSEEHGRELFAALLRGDHGTVAAFPGKTQDQQKAEIADKRYTVETDGIEFGGMALDTGRDSQGLILGAALEAFMDPTYNLNWKTSTGFISLDASMVLLIAKTIRAHVQACFDREATLSAAVESGAYTDAMLNEGWPS